MSRTREYNRVNNEASADLLKKGRLGALLAGLGLPLAIRPGQDAYRARCPMHGGDGLLVQLHGHTLPVRWRCATCRCEWTYTKCLLGLVRALLTVRSGSPEPVDMFDAIRHLEQFVGRRLRPKPAWRPLTRQQFRSRLMIPSQFFVERGFSPTVLDRMDVGYSHRLGKTIVPVYDEDGVLCIAYLERSHKPKCLSCKKCHEPDQACRYGQFKWMIRPDEFPKSAHLFNFAAAQQSDNPFVLLVEGAGDVFRAVEAGFPAVALLGTDLSDEQASKLAALGKEVVVALDNNDAGWRAAPVVRGKHHERGVPARLLHPPKDYDDVGDMPAAEVARWLKGAAA
jgi:hypothetical protein